MTRVSFTFLRDVTELVTATADVPDSIVAQGRAAVEDYLENDNEEYEIHEAHQPDPTDDMYDIQYDPDDQ